MIFTWEDYRVSKQAQRVAVVVLLWTSYVCVCFSFIEVMVNLVTYYILVYLLVS